MHPSVLDFTNIADNCFLVSTGCCHLIFSRGVSIDFVVGSAQQAVWWSAVACCYRAACAAAVPPPTTSKLCTFQCYSASMCRGCACRCLRCAFAACLHSLCDPCSPETCCAWRLWCWTCWASASTRPPHTPSCPCTSRWGTALVGVAVMCGVGFTCVERLHRPHNFQSRYKQGTVCGCCFVAILLLFSSQPCLCGSHWSSLAHRSSSMHCRAWVVSCFFNQVGTRSPS